jgi:GNAT superfamily N-acetyltransferase
LGVESRGVLSAPEPLAEHHQLADFVCDEASLERWLKQRALSNEYKGASRTFVVCSEARVVGYYCLSAGSVLHESVPGSLKRNMPEPIPVILVGRLAVHSRWQGNGIGSGLLKDAVLRAVNVSKEIGARALLCHAISQSAKHFYEHYDFVESPIDAMMMMLDLASLRD